MNTTPNNLESEIRRESGEPQLSGDIKIRIYLSRGSIFNFKNPTLISYFQKQYSRVVIEIDVSTIYSLQETLDFRIS